MCLPDPLLDLSHQVLSKVSQPGNTLSSHASDAAQSQRKPNGSICHQQVRSPPDSS